MNQVETAVGTPAHADGSDFALSKAQLAKQLAGNALFSPTNQPAPHPMTVRADPRIIEHYRQHTHELIEDLYAIAKDQQVPTGLRLAAISEYLNRAMGKPSQAIEVNLEDRRPVVVDSALAELVKLGDGKEGS